MLDRLLAYGPVVLVPGAWLAAGAAIFGAMPAGGMLVAHVVMVAFIAVFLVTGWDAMGEGALRAWRLVLAAGFVVTLAGLAGFLVPTGQRHLWTASLVGWMLLPAGGLADTGRELQDAAVVYYGGAGLSVVGACVFVATLFGVDSRFAVVALALVGAGQTAGIVEAALFR